MRARRDRTGGRPRPGDGPTAPRRRRRSANAVTVLVSVLLLGLTACADVADPGASRPPGGSPDATDAPDDAPDPTDAPDASDPQEPLLLVHTSGGLLPAGWDFARVPELTVYPDGQVVAHGPQILSYPPPALPNLVLRDLDDAGRDALVTAAREAGLLDVVPRYGRPAVADAGTTVVTLHVDGRTFAHAAEALDLVDGVGGTTGPEGADGPEGLDGPTGPDGPDGPTGRGAHDGATAWGITADELAARAELAGFLVRARQLVGDAAETGPYPVDTFAAMARPVPGVPGTGMPAEDPPPPVLPWPLQVPLADARECVLVEGADARTLQDLLGQAPFTVQLEQDGVRYEAWFRPLLPHEEGCYDV